MPQIVACGGRKQAYDDFCIAIRAKQPAMLLVDAEDAVTLASPWDHLAHRQGDQWPRPDGSTEEQCHLMVRCMESWLIADRDTLGEYFGQGFNERALPAKGADIETVLKVTVYKSLSDATRNCRTKARYGKGEHSFDLLARIDPAKVTAASKWAATFVAALKQAMAP